MWQACRCLAGYHGEVTGPGTSTCLPILKLAGVGDSWLPGSSGSPWVVALAVAILGCLALGLVLLKCCSARRLPTLDKALMQGLKPVGASEVGGLQKWRAPRELLLRAEVPGVVPVESDAERVRRSSNVPRRAPGVRVTGRPQKQRKTGRKKGKGADDTNFMAGASMA